MKNQLLLNDSLTAHFAPVPLEELVVRRCDLPHWMRPDLQRVLNMLLNEMDGLPREAQMIFVLTTNRPEVLEPALAARPGRVDQAIPSRSPFGERAGHSCLMPASFITLTQR
jgi:hypothetical protein